MRRVRYMRCRAASMAALLPPGDPAISESVARPRTADHAAGKVGAARPASAHSLSCCGSPPLTAMDAALAAVQDDLFRPLSPAEREQLTELLTRVIGARSMPGQNP